MGWLQASRDVGSERDMRVWILDLYKESNVTYLVCIASFGA